jgi:hypothetical protein
MVQDHEKNVIDFRWEAVKGIDAAVRQHGEKHVYNSRRNLRLAEVMKNSENHPPAVTLFTESAG